MSTIVFLHAHPDDEASQTAGTMRLAADAGHRVVCVYATNGDHGTLPTDLAEEETIVLRRRAEAEAGRPRLDRVFVMTNGAPEWVALLKQALAATGHYKHVASSRDLVLSWEQKYVAQAVDMLVGQRAQVFIGNGVRVRPSSVSGSCSK